MSFDYLNEAFKKLELLKEETFDTSPNGLASMKSFMDADLEDDSVRVIDPEADRDEDLQDSYIGKVITNCNVCHSNIFENKENIVIDEDGTVNAEKQCPYCGETMGFTVMGEVTEFVPTAEEDDEPKVTVDGEEVPVEDTQDALEESVARGEKSLNKANLTEGKNDAEIENWVREMLHTKQPKEYFSKSEFEDYIWECIDSTARQDQVQPRVEKICRTKGLREFFLEEKNANILEDTKNPDYKKALECATIIAWCILEVLGPNKHVTHVSQKGITKDSEWSSRDVFSSGVTTAEQDRKATDDLIARYNKNESFSDSVGTGKSLKPHTLKILKMLDEEPLTEAVNNVDVETDDSVVHIESEEGGKVTVSTEPKEPETTGEEAIGPVSDETLADIESANAPEEEPVEEGELATEEEPVAEEEPVEDEYEDVDFEEVDEESFDELGESYLKRVYENVDSFRTCDVSSDDNKLIVEGIIKFKSGAEKKTGFIFEAHSAADGKVRFTGMNEHFSRGSKSFALTGKVENKKLISESLTYNYRAKVGNGKSTRIYGTISK